VDVLSVLSGFFQQLLVRSLHHFTECSILEVIQTWLLVSPGGVQSTIGFVLQRAHACSAALESMAYSGRWTAAQVPIGSAPAEE
jgi:hypothetical protein